MERATRIELAFSAWKAVVLPLDDARVAGEAGVEPTLHGFGDQPTRPLSYSPTLLNCQRPQLGVTDRFRPGLIPDSQSGAYATQPRPP